MAQANNNIAIKWLEKPCADGVVVIAISLFPEVPGSIPERGKKKKVPMNTLVCSCEPSSDGPKPHINIDLFQIPHSKETRRNRRCLLCQDHPEVFENIANRSAQSRSKLPVLHWNACHQINSHKIHWKTVWKTQAQWLWKRCSYMA